MSVRSIRELTPRQRQIAEGISRGLKYEEIAAELSTPTRAVSPHTIRAHVRAMATLIDVDDGALSPRERILLLVKYEEWERDHRRRKVTTNG